MKLRKSAIKELSEISNIPISKKADVEEKDKIIFVDRKPFFFYHEKRLVPTLHSLKDYDVLPKVKIDEGAVKFLIKGADMMRPGITHFDEFKENDFVAILGPVAPIPIGVGIALFDSEIAKKETSGKMIKTLHYTGDIIWNSSL